MAFPTTCNARDDGKIRRNNGLSRPTTAVVFCSNIGGGRMDCNLLVDGKAGRRSKDAGAEIEQGTGTSEIEKFGSSYKKGDLKIHDNSGGMVKIGDKVNADR